MVAQSLVGEWDLLTCQGRQVLLDVRLVGPGQPTPGASHLSERVEQWEKLGPDAAGAVVEEFVESLGQDATAADSAAVAVVLPDRTVRR